MALDVNKKRQLIEKLTTQSVYSADSGMVKNVRKWLDGLAAGTLEQLDILTDMRISDAIAAASATTTPTGVSADSNSIQFGISTPLPGERDMR